MKSPFLLCGTLIFFALSPVRAAEIASNRAGGGLWSDPASWRGNKVPGAGDDVVIQKHDVIAFDRNDDGKVTCRKLQIDPKGGFTFKKGAGKVVCCVADEIESFGVIRLDTANSAGEFIELRLVGDKADKRKLKVMKGARAPLRMRRLRRRPSVVLTSPKNEKQEHVPGVVEASAGAMLEVRHADVDDIILQASKIDNTGPGPTSGSTSWIADSPDRRGSISTPAIRRSWCTTPSTGRALASSPAPAISVNASPLAEVKDNVIRGNYAQGITLYANNEVTVTGNTIEKCPIGIHNFYTLNSMLKHCTTRNCDVGVSFYHSTGGMEEIVIEGAAAALGHDHSTVQATTVEVKSLARKGVGILHDGGALTLLNCNIAPAQVKLIVQKPAADPAKPLPIPLTAFHFIVARVKGAPPGAVVEVRQRVAEPARGRRRSQRSPLARGSGRRLDAVASHPRAADRQGLDDRLEGRDLAGPGIHAQSSGTRGQGWGCAPS